MTANEIIPQTARPMPFPRVSADRTVRLVRESFAAVESQAAELSQYFYGVLFSVAPETRDLFPINMAMQRNRLLHALVHIVQMVDQPAELLPFLRQLGRDHRKFDVVSKHYEAVGIALIAALKRFLKDKWTSDVEHAWTSAYDTISRAMREAAAADTGPAWWPATVLENRKLNRDLSIIRVRPDKPLPYLAGNHISVQVPQRPRMWRYLSPANAPRDDGTLEFHVRAVRNGWVSRAICHYTRAGDMWQLGPPLGSLAVRRATGREQLLIAGGTGIAPLRAIIEDLARWKTNPVVHLFFGGPDPESLYCVGELRALAATSPWLKLVPVTEEDVLTGGEQGTLPDVVGRRGPWKRHDVLVSGSPSMVRATVARLTSGGTPRERITYDPFTVD
ncbi:NAD(P)H-flavin reductase [Amycolatopsis xylanica]|uniref:nitric oxide dioxygenase n=2 Tax=Amycolatopsis xylanica TaxID=589385 RepID=A0A1H3A828_9PSEU|nr:NAD(P)H-flavin reductase [Amycolatopsis xylanica]